MARKSSASAKSMPMVGMDAPGRTSSGSTPASMKGSKVSRKGAGRQGSGGQTIANGTKMGVMKKPV